MWYQYIFNLSVFSQIAFMIFSWSLTYLSFVIVCLAVFSGFLFIYPAWDFMWCLMSLSFKTPSLFHALYSLLLEIISERRWTFLFYSICLITLHLYIVFVFCFYSTLSYFFRTTLPNKQYSLQLCSVLFTISTDF